MAKNWYAVQHGDDYSSDNGSTVWREARKIATALHREYPNEEIRIAQCKVGDDFCDNETVIYEAKTED